MNSGLLFLNKQDFNLSQGKNGMLLTNNIPGVSLLLFYSPRCPNSNAFLPIFKKLPTIINGCCTDDGFDYFRSWLISAGRTVYEDALYNPESLVDVVDVGTSYEFECIDYIAADVYKQKTGEQIPYGGNKDVGKYDNDKDPENGGLGNDNGLILQVNYPKLWKKFRGETEMSWESANIFLAIDKIVSF